MNKTAASAAQLAKWHFASLLIHIQLQLPAVRAQTKTSCSLFNKLA